MTRPALAVVIGLLALSCQRPDDGAVVDTSAVQAMIDTMQSPNARVVGRGIELPVTLPVLDAFFAESTFVAQLKPRLDLTDSQLDSLRQVAREETARLRQHEDDGSGMAWAARELAMARINAVIGPEKAARLMALVRYYWSDVSTVADTSFADIGSGARDSAMMSAATTTSNVPTDTRVVVNAPSYRMDVFEGGQLVRTYPIAIGYPEFPLPTGTRMARSIIFNPTWTAPDEPWVEGDGKTKAGQKVAAGSKQNPLGIAKIPIGMPSLIHGGKLERNLGGFASHGCVGLTNAQMRDFSLELSRIGGGKLTDAAIQGFGKRRTVTQVIPFANAVPIELRYETIMVQGGAVHVYRDVYDYDTNNETSLAAVLASHGVTMDQLTAAERTMATDALTEMSRQVGPVGGPRTRADSIAVTRSVTGRKEVVIPVAALAGKGYPAPVLQ